MCVCVNLSNTCLFYGIFHFDSYDAMKRYKKYLTEKCVLRNNARFMDQDRRSEGESEYPEDAPPPYSMI